MANFLLTFRKQYASKIRIFCAPHSPYIPRSKSMPKNSHIRCSLSNQAFALTHTGQVHMSYLCT